MSVDQALLRQLRELIQEDKSLQDRVLQTDTGPALISPLAEAAATRGWPVDAAALEREFAQLAERQGPRALDDKQLEAVAGGVTGGEFDAASCLTFWIACAIMSEINEPITDLFDDIGDSHGARELGWC